MATGLSNYGRGLCKYYHRKHHYKSVQFTSGCQWMRQLKLTRIVSIAYFRCSS